MTITTPTIRTPMAGNGSATTHPIPFRFLNNSDIMAIHRVNATGVKTPWTNGVEFSITGAGNPTGTATISTSPVDNTPANGETVIFFLDPTIEQQTSFPSTAASYENAVDVATLQIAALNEKIGRAALFDITSSFVDVAMPDLVADGIFGVNTAGTGFEFKALASLGLSGLDIVLTSPADDHGFLYESGNWRNKTPAEMRTAWDLPALGAANTFTANQTITSTDPGIGAGPLLRLTRNSSSPAAADLLGAMLFLGEDDVSAETTYAQIIGEILDPANGSEDGALQFWTIVAGTVASRLKIGAGVWTANATGGDQGADTINTKGFFKDGVEVEVGLKSGTAIATTSGTAHGFTGIPDGTKKIVLSLNGVSLSGTDRLLVQIGDSGGYETTGYDSRSTIASATGSTSTAGFIIESAIAANSFTGQVVLTLIDTNEWIATVNGFRNDAVTSSIIGSGSKTLSATLDRVQITRSGSDTFDAGKVNVLYE